MRSKGNCSIVDLMHGKLEDIIVYGHHLIMDEPHVRVSYELMPNGQQREVVIVSLGKPKDKEYKRFEEVIGGTVMIYNVKIMHTKYNNDNASGITMSGALLSIKSAYQRILDMLKRNGVKIKEEHASEVIENFMKRYSSNPTEIISGNEMKYVLNEVIEKILETKLVYKRREITLGEFVKRLIIKGIKNVLPKSYGEKLYIKKGYNSGRAVVERLFRRWYRITITTNSEKRHKILIRI